MGPGHLAEGVSLRGVLTTVVKCRVLGTSTVCVVYQMSDSLMTSLVHHPCECKYK